jgi:hypothetical protein
MNGNVRNYLPLIQRNIAGDLESSLFTHLVQRTHKAESLRPRRQEI